MSYALVCTSRQDQESTWHHIKSTFHHKRKSYKRTSCTNTVAIRSLESKRSNDSSENRETSSRLNTGGSLIVHIENRNKYFDHVKTVNMNYIATLDERDRYQNMLVLRYKDGKNLAARSLAVASHQESKHKFYIPRGARFRQRPLNAQLQAELEWRRSELSRDMWFTSVIFFIFGNLVGAPTMAVVAISTMARTTPRRIAQPTLVDSVMATESFKPCRLLSNRFRVQTSANVVHATVSEDGTPHRTHQTTYLSWFSTRDSCARLFNNACDVGSSSR